MQEVKFRVPFMDWKKGEKANLSKDFAQKYTKMGLCDAVRPPVKQKRKTAPSNKRIAGAVNK